MIIELPDGRELEAPDDLQPAQIKAIVQKHTGARSAQPAASPAPTGPSTLASLGHGAAQGAQLGWGPKITAAVQAALPVAGDAAGYGARYDQELASARADNVKHQKAHPLAYTIGNIAGGAAPGALAAATGLGAAGQGLVLGGVGGAGDSEAQDVAGVLSDAVRGGTIGAATGKVVSLLPQALNKLGVSTGRRAIGGNANPLAAKTVLSEKAVLAADEAGGFRPLGTHEGLADRLNVKRDSLGKEKQRIVEQLTGAGVKGPDVRPMSQTLRARAREVERNTLDAKGPSAHELYDAAADEIVTKVPGQAKPRWDAQGNRLPDDPSEWRLGLQQAENIKGSQQELAKYDKIQKLTGRESARREIASTVRQSVEDAVDAQAAALPEAAERFVPIKRELGPLIEASNAAEIGANRELARNAIGLRTMATMAAHAAHGGFSPTTALVGLGAHLADHRGAQTAAWAAFRARDAANQTLRYALPLALAQSGKVYHPPQE